MRRIGRGGMAEVWVARRALGQKGTKFVALKLIADHYVGDERYTRMFRAEAELAAVLSHANIVQVFDEGEDDGRSYLVMEWVDGLNLLKLGAVLALLDDDDRRFRVTSYIIGQLLYALSYAHSITSFDGSPLGVVHRDVSPQNVLISNHGEVKLTDFGVAYHVMEESSGIHVKGKVRYMSPEQLSGKTRSPTVDLYAVGALLHELLDGKKFRGEFEDGQEMFTAVLSGVIPPLSRPAPPELDELRLRLLQPDPTDRIQTAEEAVTWLRRYPGHGDARSELTKLCSSLTGVVRPRVGPGQSSQVPMADRRTLQFKGKQALARPRVNVAGPKKPGPPPPPSRPAAAAPGGAALRTGSTTAVKGPAREPQVPVVSGQTEFVRPQGPPRGGQKRAVGSGLPAMRAAAAAPMMVPPSSSVPLQVVGQAASPIPHHVAGQASSPILQQVGQAASPVPHQVVGQAASPIPHHVAGQASSPIPHYVAGQASSPIPHQELGGGASPAPHVLAGPAISANGPLGLAPTERLMTSESSGSTPVPYGTEVIDANMIVEVISSGTTDHDLHPQVIAHEGTDTSRDIRPRSMTTSHSISIIVPRRSAIAAIVVGLVLVAVMSVTVTWWLFTKNKPGGEASPAGEASSAAVSSPVALGSEATEEPRSTGPAADAAEPAKSAVEPSGEAAEAPPEGAAPSGVTPTPDDAETPAAAVQEDSAGEGDREVEGDEGAAGQASEPVERPSAADPGSSAPKKSTPAASPKAPSKALVIIDAAPGLDGAQLRVGSEVLTIKSRKAKKKLSAGKLRVAWRLNTSSNWTPAPSVNLYAGQKLKYFFTETGPKPR
ncbi:MAG: protein kinase [Myxococcales bacterium]|nr:protein kinase [Myxococcales bacterium]